MGVMTTLTTILKVFWSEYLSKGGNETRLPHRANDLKTEQLSRELGNYVAKKTVPEITPWIFSFG